MIAFFVGSWVNGCCCCRGSLMGFFLANTLQDVGKVCLPVLRYPRELFNWSNWLLLVIHVTMFTTLAALAGEITEELTSLSHCSSYALPSWDYILFGQSAVNRAWSARARLPWGLSRRMNPVLLQILLLNASLTLWLRQRAAFLVVRGRLFSIWLMRADHGVGLHLLCLASLRLSLNNSLRAEAFRLYISIAIFLTLLDACDALCFVRATM